MLVTSSLQPHLTTTESFSLVIPALSQICKTIFLTARTCSKLAPPFIAPLRWPFNCGFTCRVLMWGYRQEFKDVGIWLTSWGIRAAIMTKLVSAAFNTDVLLKI